VRIRALALVLRVTWGSIFVYSAWTKLKDSWALFAMAVDSTGVAVVGLTGRPHAAPKVEC
jgi:hypothetical protein